MPLWCSGPSGLWRLFIDHLPALRHTAGASGRAGDRLDFDLFDMRRRFRNNIAIDSHAFDVELNCLSDKLTRFLQRRGGSYATWKIGNVCTITSGGRFKKDGIRAHFQPCLLQYRTLRLWIQVGRGMTQG